MDYCSRNMAGSHKIIQEQVCNLFKYQAFFPYEALDEFDVFDQLIDLHKNSIKVLYRGKVRDEIYTLRLEMGVRERQCVKESSRQFHVVFGILASITSGNGFLT